MPERRTAIRVPVNLKTSIEVKEKILSAQTGTTVDLSNKGMRLSQAKPLEPGREVSISFELPAEGQISGRGVVVWCGESKDGREGYQAGIRWVQVHPTAQARLNAFLADRAQTWLPFLSPFSFAAQQRTLRWLKALRVAFLIAVIIGGIVMLWLDRVRLSMEAEALKARLGSTDQLVRNFINRLFHSP